MSDFKSGRWDVDELINNGKNLAALAILWRGRANDIEDWHGNELTSEQKVMVDTLKQCADQLSQALAICEGDSDE